MNKKLRLDKTVFMSLPLNILWERYVALCDKYERLEMDYEKLFKRKIKVKKKWTRAEQQIAELVQANIDQQNRDRDNGALSQDEQERSFTDSLILVWWEKSKISTLTFQTLRDFYWEVLPESTLSEYTIKKWHTACRAAYQKEQVDYDRFFRIARYARNHSLDSYTE